MPATTNFLPAREADLVTWANNFVAQLTILGTAVGTTAGQLTTFTGLKDAFLSAYAIANSDATRTPASIFGKDAAKKAMTDNARLLSGIIQKFPGTTDVQRSELGLTVPAVRSPRPAPAMAPTVDILSVDGSTVRVRMHDPENPTRRGKPDGVAGMTVFSFVGATAPTTEEDWTFQGNTTRTVVEINFPTGVPGAKVWFTAFYRNERDQRGPAADPVGTNIAGGSAMAA
jgi:hypothetical protein